MFQPRENTLFGDQFVCLFVFFSSLISNSWYSGIVKMRKQKNGGMFPIFIMERCNEFFMGVFWPSKTSLAGFFFQHGNAGAFMDSKINMCQVSGISYQIYRLCEGNTKEEKRLFFSWATVLLNTIKKRIWRSVVLPKVGCVGWFQRSRYVLPKLFNGTVGNQLHSEKVASKIWRRKNM